MDFRIATQQQFPLCTKYASTELQPGPLKKNKPDVWAAFVRACESDRWAKTALTWDDPSGPTVSPIAGLVTDKPTAGHNNISGCGFTRAPRFNADIEIDAILFNAVEKAVYAGDRDFAKLHLEVTILHELVHWARFQVGANILLWTDPPIAGAEAGSVFEMWAYKRLYCTDLEFSRLAASYM